MKDCRRQGYSFIDIKISSLPSHRLLRKKAMKKPAEMFPQVFVYLHERKVSPILLLLPQPQELPVLLQGQEQQVLLLLPELPV